MEGAKRRKIRFLLCQKSSRKKQKNLAKLKIKCLRKNFAQKML